jgi:peptidyl-prolyl cis-trans isomerase C
MAFRHFYGAALALVLAANPMVLAAQQEGGTEDKVVARVNGEEVRQSDVMAMARTLPAEYQAQLMAIYPMLVQRLVDFKLAGKAGRDAGLASDDRVKAFVAKAEEQAVRELYLEREIEARIDDEMIQEAYQVHLADNPPAEELHARHILVETEEEAREVIGLLDGGADFAELAKERSTGPSGPKGGDLGYFTANQMVPEFSQAAAALEPGSYTKEPAKTQFGWHVIKLEDRRTAAPPPLEELEQQLREQVAREILRTVLIGLRDGAEIEIVSESAEPAGEAAPEPAPEPAPAQ